MQKNGHYRTNGSAAHSLGMGESRANAAANLKRIRLALGYSVRALSIRAGVSRNTIDNIEGNRNAVTLDALESVADALGLKAWELLKPPQPGAIKAVAKIPKPRAATPLASGAAAELFGSVDRLKGPIRRAIREVVEAVEDASNRSSTSTDRNRTRPAGRKKVGKAGKSRTNT